MSAVSSAAAFICGCAVLCSMINLIAPDSKMRKPASLALAMFFLCSLISPVKGFIDGISGLFNEISFENLTEPTAAFDYEEMLLQETVQNMVDSLDLLLREDGIVVKNISISAHIDANGSIKLGSINIYIDEASSTELLNIKNTVYKNFGLVPSITAGNENGTQN